VWLVKKGGSLGGLDFDQGGQRFLADPLQPLNPAGAQQLATSSGCTTFASLPAGKNLWHDAPPSPQEDCSISMFKYPSTAARCPG
jgi:hypothetical protein